MSVNYFLGNQTIDKALTDELGNLVYGKCTFANIPSAVAGYAIGCELIASDTGNHYFNKGTTSSCSFVLVDSGTAFSLPASATDAVTTTGNSFALTTSALTTGSGSLITAAALTTGAAFKATLGTSLTTGGAFNANLGAAVTGYALSSTTTGVYTGAGLIQLTANSATTGVGQFITMNGLTLGKALSITTSSSSTDAGTSFEPVTVATTMTGIGGVGGRFKSSLTTNVALGSWSNALKGEVTYGASGRTTGLGSAIVAEMTLSAGTSSGNYALLEGELNLATGAVTGTATSLIYLSVNGADAATFSTTNGFIMNLQGLTAGASNVFRTGLVAATVNAATTAALQIKIGSTTYFIPLATATA